MREDDRGSTAALMIPDEWEERLRNAIIEADIAFWEKISEAFPEIITGDFGPDETIRWDNACDDAVRTWLLNNREVDEDEA